MDCAFCIQDSHPLPKTPSLKHCEKVMSDDAISKSDMSNYVDQQFPDLLNGLTKIPHVRFYHHGQSKQCKEPDLFTDEYMNAHIKTKRNRQAAEDEESIARKICNWANDSNNGPAIVICNFPLQHRLQKFLNN